MNKKESEITPINVLVRVFLNQQYEYNPHKIIGLEYKHRNKPSLMTEDGETIGRWGIERVLLDTPETRKTLEIANDLYDQIIELQKRLRELMATTTPIDVGKLHETIIVSTKQRGGEE